MLVVKSHTIWQETLVAIIFGTTGWTKILVKIYVNKQISQKITTNFDGFGLVNH